MDLVLGTHPHVIEPIEWVEDEKIDSLPLWEGDRVFLPLIRGEHDFFCLKLIYSGDRLTKAVFE